MCGAMSYRSPRNSLRKKRRHPRAECSRVQRIAAIAAVQLYPDIKNTNFNVKIKHKMIIAPEFICFLAKFPLAVICFSA
jgi:hypothetical protein